MFPIYRTLDTLKKSRQYFRFPSNKLDYLGKVLNAGRKLDHEGMKLWIDICEHNNKASLKKMTDYCIRYNYIDSVPDPYYGGDQGFELVLDILEDACEGLLNKIIPEIEN